MSAATENGRAARPGIGPVAALALIFVAVAFQAGVQGTMTAWIDPADSMLFSALAFALTTVVFCAIAAGRRIARPASAAPGMPWRTMVAMNVATAVTFLSFYASISMIPAATTGALESAFGPIAIAALGYLIRRTASSRRQWLIAAALVVLGAALAAQTADGVVDFGITGLGVLLAVLAGWGMAAVTLISRSLGELGVSPVSVTAHRFHASYLAAAAIWAVGRPDVPEPGHVLLLLGLGVLATSIPLFLLQLGVQRADPFSAMLVITALPALTYLVQLFAGVPLEPLSLLLILAIIGVSALGVLRR